MSNRTSDEGNADRQERYESNITTDHDRIRRWADERNVQPAYQEDAAADKSSYQFVREGEAGEGYREHEWDEFFDRFDAENRAFLYREGDDDIGHYEVLDRDEAATRATIEDSRVDERLLEGETVTTEVTETTVVRREIVETDRIESEIVDREPIRSRITDAELVDWEVIDANADFDLRADEDLAGREIDVTRGDETFHYDDVDLATHVDGHCTAEVEETWRIRRVVDERATIESQIVDTDIEERDTVEDDAVETQVETADVQRTIFESDAVNADADVVTGEGEVVRTERLGDDRFESQVTERRVIEDEIRRRKRFRFEPIGSEILETETLDTEVVDTDVVEIGHEDEEIAVDETRAEAGRAVATDEAGRVFTDDDEGKDVVTEGGEKIGIVERVEDGVAYVEPNPGLLDRIESALGWGDVEDDYRLNSSQIREVDERGRLVVSPDAEAAIEHRDDENSDD